MIKIEVNNKQFRKTKIVATLGPACGSVEKMVDMIHAGMNCARFNFSHGNHEEHKERLDMLHEAMKKTGKKVALLLDTKGPEIRTGIVEGDPIQIKDNTTITISGQETHTTPECIALSYQNIHSEINTGNKIKIADGSIILEVEKIDNTNVMCKVIKGGSLSSRKNVNIPDAIINLPNISAKDVEDIKFAAHHKYDYIAASFIRNSEAIISIRTILTENNSATNIIAKIENQEGLNNLESIVQLADGIMIARGDLAEQIPAEQIPLVQKKIIKYCVDNHKIAITATQMLQSMEESISPTRAELTDVANAIFDGTDAIMLSGETAQGKYPAEAIATMNNVALAVEESEQFADHVSKTFFAHERTALLEEEASVDSMVVAAQIIANKINASALVCPSLTGNTPKLVSVLRPPQPIIATTHLDQVLTQLLLLWGTYPIKTVPCTTDKELIETSINKTRESGFLKKNGKIVIVAGLPINKPLMLNTVQVHFDGTIIARGRQGCGPTIQGCFHKANNITEIEKHMAANPAKHFIYCLPKFSFMDTLILKKIDALLVEHPSEVPIHSIATQFPHVAFVSHINALMFQNISDEREIVVAGTEKYIYEP